MQSSGQWERVSSIPGNIGALGDLSHGVGSAQIQAVLTDSTA
jgi:homoaconitase/3-isopropylmalate dehydratase large subunit